MVADNTAEKVSVMGRPSGYDPAYAQQVKELAQNGATEREIAKFLDVSENTLRNWSHRYVDMFVALKQGKEAQNDRVERALYHRAVGYTYDSEKIFQFKGEPVVVPCVEHVPPSESAATFWLKNRRPKEWKDKTEVESTVTHEVGDSIMSLIGSMRAEQVPTDDTPVIDADVIEQPQISQAPAVAPLSIVTEEEVC